MDWPVLILLGPVPALPLPLSFLLPHHPPVPSIQCALFCLPLEVPIFLVPHAAHCRPHTFSQKPVLHGSVTPNPGFSLGSRGCFHRLSLPDPPPEAQALAGWESAPGASEHWQRTFSPSGPSGPLLLLEEASVGPGNTSCSDRRLASQGKQTVVTRDVLTYRHVGAVGQEGEVLPVSWPSCAELQGPGQCPCNLAVLWAPP